MSNLDYTEQTSIEHINNQTKSSDTSSEYTNRQAQGKHFLINFEWAR